VNRLRATAEYHSEMISNNTVSEMTLTHSLTHSVLSVSLLLVLMWAADLYTVY